MQKEIRSNELLANATEDRIISGYALKFNTMSNPIKSGNDLFYEIIMPGAITEQFIYEQDVKCLFNHNSDSGILARSKKGKGTLFLRVDETGLFYSFKAKNSPLDEQVYQSIKAGDITGSSFAFSVPDGGDKWTRENNRIIRRIYKIGGFYDVSPVVDPAYNSSSVNARNIENALNDDVSYYQNLQLLIHGKHNNLGEYFENLTSQYK